MSGLFDSINFVERIVAVTKKYQEGEKELKGQFEELLETIIQRIIHLLAKLEESGEQAQDTRQMIDFLANYLDSKEKDYLNTIGGSQFI